MQRSQLLKCFLKFNKQKPNEKPNGIIDLLLIENIEINNADKKFIIYFCFLDNYIDLTLVLSQAKENLNCGASQKMKGIYGQKHCIF